MSYQLGFLKKYIESNSDVTLEEILNDEDFLDELKIKDDRLINL
jgi:hypothetical protein